MKDKAIQKIKQGLNMPATETEVSRIRDFRRFDDIVTAPLHGFCGVKDYYEQTTIRHFLKRIEHPTLIIHAVDDPLVPPSSIPKQTELSPSVALEVYEKGGHVGFLQGTVPWRLHHWLTDRIVQGLRHGQDFSSIR